MQGFTFVAFITDVFAEYIVGLWVSSLMEMTLVLDVREQKLWGRRLSGSIRHSDKRSQYVSLAYTQRLKKARLLVSTGGVHATRITTRWRRASILSTKRR